MVFRVFGTSAQAASAPNVVTYQGRVLDANGTPLSATSLSMKFFFYTSSSGGTCVWSNSSATCNSNTPASTTARTVSLTNGLFTQNLGDTSSSFAAIADSTFADNGTIYLEVIIGTETLTPRRMITAAPYALNADTLDGIDLSVIQLWEVGTSGSYEDDSAAIVGVDGAFSYGSGGVGDLRVADQLEVMGDGYFDNNLVVGASTSVTETIANSGFSLGGNDLFVASDAGIEGILYLDGGASFNLSGTSDFTVEDDGTIFFTFNDDRSIDYASNQTTTDPFDFSADSVTTGNAFDLSVNGITSGRGVNITSTSGVNTGADLLRVNATATYTSTSLVLGNILDVSRTLTANDGNSGVVSSLGVGSAVASITDACTVVGNDVCTHAGPVLSLVQNSANAQGGLLSISNNGDAIGTSILITGSHTGTAISVSDADFSTALDVGQNFILFDAMREFGSASGTITWEDTAGNDLMRLVDNSNAGDLTLTGDLALSGGDLTSTSSTFNLLDATGNSTTIEIGGVSTDLGNTIRIATQGTTADVISIGNTTAATTMELFGGDDWSVTTAGVLTGSDFVCTDCLDFGDFEDTLNLDVATEIDNGLTDGNLFSINLSSTGDFTVEDADTAFFTFNDDRSIDYTSNQTTTDPFDFSANSVTTGNALDLTVNGITTGRGINLTSTSIVNTSADLFRVSATGIYAAGTAVTGNLLDISRSLNINDGTGAVNTLAVTTPVVTISDACSGEAGSNDVCFHTGPVLSLTQSTTNSNSAVLLITNNGDALGDTIRFAGSHAGAAIDASLSSISEALDAGQNFILFDAMRQFGSASGTITWEDTSGNDLMTLVDNANVGDLTLTGELITVFSTTGSFTAATCWDGSGSSSLRDCVGAVNADYAEQYPVATGISFGDIVVPGTKTVTTANAETVVQLIKSTRPYQGPVSGIVSNNYGDFTSAGYNIPESENPMPVALVGRVLVNVTNENGAIKVGDYLTTSSTPGKAMKATEVGRVIGMALADFSGTSGQVMVQVHNGWYMGDIIATDGSSTVLTDKVVMAPLATANKETPNVDSFGFALRGSAFDGSQARAVEMMLKTSVIDTNNYRLSIRSTTDSEVAYITNKGTMQIAGDLVISGKFYPSDRDAIQTNKYIYYDGSQGAGGDFMRTNAKGWSTSSSDFAEMFPSDETLQEGEVVVFSGIGENVKRSSSANAQQITGIVSTRPGFLAGENTIGAHPIALVGRVPTRVSAENGEIKVGDPLTTSSTPGYAMKATKPGTIVGYALEPLAFAQKSILVYVNVGYWGGEATSTTPGTNNQASGFASGTNVNYTALNMSGNIYVSGHEIISVGRISGISDVWSIEQDGTMRTEGLIKTITRSYTDEKVETIVVTSPEVVVTLTGTAKLSGGQAEVRFEQFAPTFNDVTAATAPLRVIVTPTGPVSLYVSEKDNNHFVVKQFAGEQMDVEFDWMVTAYRKGYEPQVNEDRWNDRTDSVGGSPDVLSVPASPVSPDETIVDSTTDDEGGAQAEQPSESFIETSPAQEIAPTSGT